MDDDPPTFFSEIMEDEKLNIFDHGNLGRIWGKVFFFQLFFFLLIWGDFHDFCLESFTFFQQKTPFREIFWELIMGARVDDCM